jgi:anti-sigma regulatory factor (Ser/Thr protein kinase)
MTVAEVCEEMHQPAALGLCRVRVWLLPTGSSHHAECSARAIIRDVLQGSGATDDDVLEAEHIIAELAVNAVQHAVPPYELRIVFVGDVWPVWCELADGSPALDRVRQLLHSATTPVSDGVIPELSEGGRGLRLVGGLSNGRCAAYSAVLCRTGTAGKAVGFALPGADTA